LGHDRRFSGITVSADGNRTVLGRPEQSIMLRCEPGGVFPPRSPLRRIHTSPVAPGGTGFTPPQAHRNVPDALPGSLPSVDKVLIMVVIELAFWGVTGVTGAT